MTSRFTGLAATQRGRTGQVAKAFKGLAADLKNKQVFNPDCDEPQTLEAAKRVIVALQQQLADAEALIAEMRAASNSDAPAATADAEANSDAPAATADTVHLWNTARVARESHVAVCTICRNVDLLGGIRVGKDWLFPVGTTYGRRRKRK
jgi:hypothetical protein